LDCRKRVVIEKALEIHMKLKLEVNVEREQDQENYGEQ